MTSIITFIVCNFFIHTIHIENDTVLPCEFPQVQRHVTEHNIIPCYICFLTLCCSSLTPWGTCMYSVFYKGSGVVMVLSDRAAQSMYCSTAFSSVLFPMVRIPAAWFLDPCRSWWSRLCRRWSSSPRLPRVRIPAAASPVRAPLTKLPPERHSRM